MDKRKIKRMEILRRRRRVSDMLLRGVTSQEQMAARLGVSQPTIALDVRAIYLSWVEGDIKRAVEKRARRVRQLEFAASRSFDAFERSQQNAETVTTEYRQARCPDCRGTTWLNGDPDTEEWCPTCKGDGTIIVEHVTRQVRGQAGDSSHLGNFWRIIAEIAKMEGCYPTQVNIRQKVVQKNQQFNIGAVAVGAVDYSRVPNEVLIQAMESLERLNQAAGNGSGNGKVLGVENQKENGNE